MAEKEEFEDWDEESQEWSPEWYDFDLEKLLKKKKETVVVADYAQKEWTPYTGPLGGRGWRSTKDPDIIYYQEEKPHEDEEDAIWHMTEKPDEMKFFMSEDVAATFAKEKLDAFPEARIVISRQPPGVNFSEEYGDSFEVKIFHPPPKSPEEAIKTAFMRMKRAWENASTVDIGSRQAQKSIAKAFGISPPEAHELINMEAQWTTGNVRWMRNVLSMAKTGRPLDDFWRWSNPELLTEDQQTGFAKWKDIYFDLIRQIVHDGRQYIIDAGGKRGIDRSESFYLPAKSTINTIHSKIMEDGIHLYRGLVVKAEVFNKVKEDGEISLLVNNLDSWSASDEIAMGFSSGSSTSPDDVAVVLEYKASKDEIVNGWPFIGYSNEAEFMVELNQEAKYKITNIRKYEEPHKVPRQILTIEKMTTEEKKDSVIVFDLTGDNDWAAMRRKKKEKSETTIADYEEE